MKEGKKLYDITLDICKLFKKTPLSDFVMPFVNKFVEKFGKIPTGCPIQTGEYYMYNATMKGIPVSDIPFSYYYLSQNQDTFITFESSTKIKGTLVKMFNVTMTGGYRHE